MSHRNSRRTSGEMFAHLRVALAKINQNIEVGSLPLIQGKLLPFL